MSDLLRTHAAGLAEFGRRLRAVRAVQWDDPTPCTGWSVRTLVNHLVVEQLWVPPLLAGKSIEDVGGTFDGDQLGSDAIAAWEAAADASRAGFCAEGALQRAVNLSYGDTPAADYCAEMITDLVVHSWDLARATGADERLDPDLIRFAHDHGAGQADELAASGYFAEALPVGSDSDAQTTMLALYGRRV